MKKIDSLLAFDISTRATGYAYYEGDDKPKESGVIKGKGRHAEDRYLGLCLDMEELIQRVKPKIVVVEGSFYKKDFKAFKYALKLQGHAEYLALKRGVIFFTMAISTWRHELNFPSNFEKTTSETYKTLSKKYAKELLGHEPKDDNEADAICIGKAYRILEKKQE